MSTDKYTRAELLINLGKSAAELAGKANRTDAINKANEIAGKCFDKAYEILSAGDE